MNRQLTTAAVGIALLLTAGCGGDAPQASTPPAEEVVLPQASEVVDVPVTRPENPQPLDISQLPATARVLNRMPGLTDDERTCANVAVKTTLDGDPSIAATNGKMASVLGNSVVACTTPERLATVVSGSLAPEGQTLTPEQRSCLERHISGDTRGTARFLAAVLTIDVRAVMAESQRYDDACKVDVAPE